MENGTFHLFAASGKREQKTKAQVIFLNPFTICSLCKQQFVVLSVYFFVKHVQTD